MNYFSTIDIDYAYIALDSTTRIYTIHKNLKCITKEEYFNNSKKCIELCCDSIPVKSEDSSGYNGYHRSFYMLIEDFNKYFISERQAKLRLL